MDANNQIPNNPIPQWAIFIIRILSFIFISPIFILVWIYASIRSISYIIFTPSRDKKHHKKLMMEAHKINEFSNLKLTWYKALSIIEKFQALPFNKIMFMNICIWIELIILYIKYIR